MLPKEEVEVSIFSCFSVLFLLGSPHVELLSLLVVMMLIVLWLVTDLHQDFDDCWDTVVDF